MQVGLENFGFGSGTYIVPKFKRGHGIPEIERKQKQAVRDRDIASGGCWQGIRIAKSGHVRGAKLKKNSRREKKAEHDKHITTHYNTQLDN